MINNVSVFDTETAGVAESITVITTVLVLAAAGVPEITPVAGAIVKLAGKPVADQV